MSTYKRINGDYTIQTVIPTGNVSIQAQTVTVTGNLVVVSLGNTALANTTVTGNLYVSGNITVGGGTFLYTTANLSNASAALTATLTNSPKTGNPTKWIPINDNGVVRYIPAW